MNSFLREVSIRVISGVLVVLIILGLMELFSRMYPKKPCDCNKKPSDPAAPGQSAVQTNSATIPDMFGGMMGLGEGNMDIQISMGQ